MYKWIEKRVSEYLLKKDIDLNAEDFSKLTDEVDSWVFENIDKVIEEKLKEVKP
ncbi:hypothetical protein QO179_24180 [Bacillus stercoris]|nr:hypothetical protein [Bacillus stercoris]